ncbi:unnamed protein product [Ectocarpus sp. CCAP 1310/34]|nr:unnamed protein product [Ectocarpus sp. CCAP 1310/34]
MLFLALWGIVLLAGAALWVRSEPMRTTLLPYPASELTGSRFRRRGGAAQLWAAAAEVESDDGKGAVGGGNHEGESTVAESARKWRDLVVLLALAPPALDATAQFCFLRMAARSCSAWLAVGLFIASTVYACLVGASVVLAGVAELKGGEGKFRCLVASWHALLLLTAVGTLSQQQWDRTVVRQGLGSMLLSLAAWQLGGLSARRVEGAVRYSLVVTVQKALGEASNHEVIAALEVVCLSFSLPALTAEPPYPWPNHPPSGQPRPKHATHKHPCIEKFSPESLLELAAGRWLIEYWSQPPTFSALELREMLVQAVSSITRERLVGSTSGRGGGGGGGGDGGDRGRSSGDMHDTFVKDGVRDSPELTEAPSPGRGVEALTGWLEGRGSEPPVPRFWRPVETLASASPGWVLVSSEAPLLLRACPTSCASAFLLLRSLVGGASWMEWAFLLALAGPAAVELWRLRVLRKEVGAVALPPQQKMFLTKRKGSGRGHTDPNPTPQLNRFYVSSSVTGAPSGWLVANMVSNLPLPNRVGAVLSSLQQLTRKKRDHGPLQPPPPPLPRRTQAAGAAGDRLSLLLRESNPPLENVWKNAARLAEKLGEDPAGGGGDGRPSPRVVDRVVAGVAVSGATDAPRVSCPEAASAVPKSSLPVDRDKADIFRADLAARIGAERVLGGRPRLLKDYLAFSRPRSAESPAYPGRFTGSRTNNSLGLGLTRPLAGSPGSLNGATATAVAPTAAPAPTAGDDAGVGLGGVSAGTEEGRSARASSAPAETAAAEDTEAAAPLSPPEEAAVAVSGGAQVSEEAMAAWPSATSPVPSASPPPLSPPSRCSADGEEPTAAALPAADTAAAAIEASADAATAAIPVRGDPGDDDAWDLFGATWAGTVVGAAGELAGAIGDVAGGALGSVPVLGGVLEWWGGGGAPEKAEDSVGGGGGCEALAAEKDSTVDGAIDGVTIDGTIDGAANVSRGGGGGGGGVESSARRAGSSDHSGIESVGALSKAAEGSSGGADTGELHKAGESTGQEQGGLLVEDEASSVADDAPGTARQPAEAKNPSASTPISNGDAGSEEDFDCDDGGSENEDRREKQRPTSASLSPLCTIDDTTTTSSKVTAQLPPGDDVSNGDGQQQQQQQQQRESPCAGTNTPSSACRDEGQGGESTTTPEEEHGVDHKSSIVSSSSSNNNNNNDERDTTTPASAVASLAAREEEERGETDAVESMAATQIAAPEITGVESEGKAQEAGSGPHGLTGMAWWTVSRAVEFAGGAAYGFLPGFQDAKEAGGERGGEGDDTKEASGEQ